MLSSTHLLSAWVSRASTTCSYSSNSHSSLALMWGAYAIGLLSLLFCYLYLRSELFYLLLEVTYLSFVRQSLNLRTIRTVNILLSCWFSRSSSVWCAVSRVKGKPLPTSTDNWLEMCSEYTGICYRSWCIDHVRLVSILLRLELT